MLQKLLRKKLYNIGLARVSRSGKKMLFRVPQRNALSAWPGVMSYLGITVKDVCACAGSHCRCHYAPVHRDALWHILFQILPVIQALQSSHLLTWALPAHLPTCTSFPHQPCSTYTSPFHIIRSLFPLWPCFFALSHLHLPVTACELICIFYRPLKSLNPLLSASWPLSRCLALTSLTVIN